MNDTEFIRLWNESATTQHAAQSVGITKRACAVKASRLRKIGHALKMMPPPIKSLDERFWSMVEKTECCWMWTGSVNNKGYGQIATRRGSRPLQTHRYSWQIHFGEIPEEKMILHSCDNPRCVNPSHLFVGTAKDNTRDMIRKYRGHWQDNAPRRRKTLLKERILLEGANRELAEM